MTRLATAEAAIQGGKRLTFDYMKLNGGRKSIRRRVVAPLGLSTAKDGHAILTGEDESRDGRPRSFRVERMFHVNLV